MLASGYRGAAFAPSAATRLRGLWRGRVRADRPRVATRRPSCRLASACVALCELAPDCSRSLPVSPSRGLDPMQPQCEVCDDTVASIHCQVGPAVACCPRWRRQAAPANATARAGASCIEPLGARVSSKHGHSPPAAHRSPARTHTHTCTHALAQECRRKTCEECDEILHLVGANMCKHACRRDRLTPLPGDPLPHAPSPPDFLSSNCPVPSVLQERGARHMQRTLGGAHLGRQCGAYLMG